MFLCKLARSDLVTHPPKTVLTRGQSGKPRESDANYGLLLINLAPSDVLCREGPSDRNLDLHIKYFSVEHS